LVFAKQVAAEDVADGGNFLFESSNSKISFRKRLEQKNLWVSFLKEAAKGCPDPQRLLYKGSL